MNLPMQAHFEKALTCLPAELGIGRGSRWGHRACEGYAAEGHHGAARVSALLACLGQAGADSWQC